MKGNKLTRLYYKSLRGVKNNASTILTVCAAVGVVATAVLAVKETPKAQARIKEAREEKGEALTKVEVAVNGGIEYLPAIGAGASTIFCIVCANHISVKKQKSLVAAYEMLANYHKAYVDTLIKLKGEEVDKEVRCELARQRADYHIIDLDAADDKCIWYDDITGASVTMYERELMDAEYHLNRIFSMKGEATVNDWCRMLGLPWDIEGGDEIGWCWAQGIQWIDFEHYPVDRDSPNPVYCVSAVFPPEVLDEY